MELNKINDKGRWDGTATSLNDNFAKVNAELEKLKAANIKFKGFFSSTTTLSVAHPRPTVGDTAWVGNTYPGMVYECKSAGVWANTNKAPVTPSVELTDYAKTELLDRRTTEYNVSVQHPSSGIDGTNKFTLALAIALVPSPLRTVGIKCSFLNDAGTVETWTFLGGVWRWELFENASNLNNDIKNKLNTDYVKTENIYNRPNILTWGNAIFVTSYNQETSVFNEGIEVDAKKIIYKPEGDLDMGKGGFGCSIPASYVIPEAIITASLTIWSDTDINRITLNSWGIYKFLNGNSLKINKGINNISITLKVNEELPSTFNTEFWIAVSRSFSNAIFYIRGNSCIYRGTQRFEILPTPTDYLPEAKSYTDRRVDTYEPGSYLYCIIDSEDNILFSISKEGYVYWEKTISPDILSLQDKMNSMVSFETENGAYIYSILDSEDKVIFAIDKYGYVHGVLSKYFDDIDYSIKKIDKKVTQLGNLMVKIIPCWGDSLTAANRYQAEMRKQLGSDYNVVNCGVGGENSQVITGRQGGIPFYLLNSITIPSNGSEVEIGNVNDSGLRLIDVTGEEIKCTPLRQGEGMATINPCVIEDLECRIRWTGTTWNDPNGKYLLKRVAASSKDHTTQPKAMIFTNGAKIYRNPFAMVVWIGQNGGWSSSSEEAIRNTLVKQYQKIIAFAGTANYLCIGLHTGTASSRAVLEKVMVEEFSDRYINWREYCSTRALSDAGITPSEADLQAMAVGSCPPSLLGDAVHHNAIGNDLLGKQIMHRFRYLGFIK